MLAANIGTVLAVTGVITAAPILLFIAPVQGLRMLFKLQLADEGALLMARHWGLLAFCIGALLVYAAGHPEVRVPVVAVALLEKAGLVVLIVSRWKAPHTRGMHVTAMFDGVCSVVYAAWLLG
jgi:hypothetical protein